VPYRLGHETAIPPIVVSGVPRLDPVWTERFLAYGSCDVADVVGPLYTMAPAIRPLFRPIDRVVGRALTVKAWPGDNLAIHGALSRVESGDVLVVDWRGQVDACGGGAQILVEPQRYGLRGVVIDGAWRDAESVAELGLPVFGRGVSATSPPKRQPGEINVPVACGGVVVAPGDLVVADAAGVAVVPRVHLDRVWPALQAAPGPPSDAAERERRADVRRSHFEQAFADAGGISTPWASR
jgi:4-hydroxy-4-methyl-2-oxoglutarate aldolase